MFQSFLCIWLIVLISIRFMSSNEFADLEAVCHIAEKTKKRQPSDNLTTAICKRNRKSPIDKLRLLSSNQPQQTQSFKKRGGGGNRAAWRIQIFFIAESVPIPRMIWTRFFLFLWIAFQSENLRRSAFYTVDTAVFAHSAFSEKCVVLAYFVNVIIDITMLLCVVFH